MADWTIYEGFSTLISQKTAGESVFISRKDFYKQWHENQAMFQGVEEENKASNIYKVEISTAEWPSKRNKGGIYNVKPEHGTRNQGTSATQTHEARKRPPVLQLQAFKVFRKICARVFSDI